MKTLPPQIRRDLGCGFEPHNEDARTWLPPAAGSRLGFGAELGEQALQDRSYELQTCPGYTTKLPPVIDVLRARVHWGKGTLGAYCGSAPPTKHLLTAIEVLDGSCARADRWAETDEKDGGGRRSKS
jgi:hypothetical protein